MSQKSLESLTASRSRRQALLLCAGAFSGGHYRAADRGPLSARAHAMQCA